MGKTKTWLLAGVGAVVGIVTLRRVRKRRSTPEAEARTAVEQALDETAMAADHAVAAAGHARVAGEKAVEFAREELDGVEVNTDRALPTGSPVDRLRESTESEQKQ